jgi:hypothetical protein
MAVSGRDAMLHRRVLLGGVTKGQSAFFLIIEGRHVSCQSCLHRDKRSVVLMPNLAGGEMGRFLEGDFLFGNPPANRFFGFQSGPEVA